MEQSSNDNLPELPENEETTSFLGADDLLLSSDILASNSLNNSEMGVPNTWPEDDFSSPDGMPLLEIQPESGPFNSPENSTLFTAVPSPSLAEDIKDPAGTPGLCGLRNLGNTCFLNSGLQCILNNQQFMSSLLHPSVISRIKPDSVTAKLVEAAAKVWSGNYSLLNLSEFKEKFGKCFTQFSDYRQHDCQEFLTLLFDILHGELNTAKPVDKELATTSLPDHTFMASPARELFEDDKAVEFDPNETRSDPTTDYDEEDDPTEPLLEDPAADIDAEPGSSKTLLHPTLSDASSHSTSPRSTDSLDSWKVNSAFRFCPLPENVKPFKDVNCIPSSSSKLASSSSLPFNSSHQSDTTHPDSLSGSTETINACDTALENIIPIEKLSRGKPFLGCSLKRPSSYLHSTDIEGKGVRKLEKNELAASQLNAPRKQLPSLEDFVKDTKTLNTNVLVTEEVNNQLKFDSEKFPKLDQLIRPKETVDNLSMDYSPSMTEDGDLKKGSKTFLKETNLLKSEQQNLTLATKVADPSSSSCTEDLYATLPGKRLKLSDDGEELEPDGDSNGSLGSTDIKCPTNATLLENEADSEWARYKSKNQSVVVETFQGQFRSKVVCNTCGHVSVTYEPFMSLPVQLPHALERQIVVTYMPSGGNSRPTRYLAKVHKQDKVHRLRERLQEYIGGGDPSEILLAEVQNNAISRIIDDNALIRYLNDKTKSIYAFEVVPPPDSLRPCLLDSDPSLPLSQLGVEGGGDPCGDFEVSQQGPQPSTSLLPPPGGTRTCVICLEELPLEELLIHPSCQCILCLHCIELSCTHFGGDTITCPVCNLLVKPHEEFIPLTSLGDQPLITNNVACIPILFRVDNPETKEVEVIGHPSLVKLPTTLSAALLYEYVDRYVPYLTPYSLLFVNDQGKSCSRCLSSRHCSGCEVARVGDVTLHHGESLAIRMEEIVGSNLASPFAVEDHHSMSLRRPHDYVTIYDCLNAFSQSESLDEHNPWNCPKCCRNQHANKSLALWRCPDTLMIYLKRFVYHNMASVKVDDQVLFPLEDLDLSPYVAGPSHPSGFLYNLQACICHFGGMSSGHYTAYAKHALSGDWYYFNDDVFTKQAPKEEDYTNAYILFYQRPDAMRSAEPPEFFQQEFVLRLLKELESRPESL